MDDLKKESEAATGCEASAVERLVTPPNLRSYSAFMSDMKWFIDQDSNILLTDEKMWPIRDLYAQLKHDGINLHGLKPRGADRLKIVNRYKKKRLSDADREYYGGICTGWLTSELCGRSVFCAAPNERLVILRTKNIPHCFDI